MISYVDAPQFHILVDNRDYRMICIFETYSQNRFEDDFLENLGLIAQITKDIDNSPEEEGEEVTEQQPLPDDSFSREIVIAQRDGKLEETVANFCIDKRQSGDRKINMIYKSFKTTGDHDDFLHSIKRFYNKANQ